MKLAIFNIDGTLTKTNQIDDDCFIKAFADSHQIFDFETDWNKYEDVTDIGIFTEIFKDKFNREPSDKDLSIFKSCFIKRLTEIVAKDETLFAEIPNAKMIVEKLKLEDDWVIALATSCFYESAKLKLEVAKISVEDFPLATADDTISRELILLSAIRKSFKFFRQNEFEEAVSIGDGVWDVRAAKNLKLRFVGIADDVEYANKLRQEGAEFIIEDFRDYEVFIEYLNK